MSTKKEQEKVLTAPSELVVLGRLKIGQYLVESYAGIA